MSVLPTSQFPDADRAAIGLPAPLASLDAKAWQMLIDHLACGVSLYDAQHRFVLCNAEFRRLYAPMADELVPGRSFEALLRSAVAYGLVPEANGCEAAWIADRLRQLGRPQAQHLRQQSDGHWRRIVETNLPDGALLSFSVDVTEEVNQTLRTQDALASARVATQRLEDAIEALPAGFELWDADDRLIAANSELGRLYPRVAELFRPGTAWEDIVRANHAAGGLTAPEDGLEPYLARRRVERRTSGSPAAHTTPDGRWVRTIERPTRDGGTVGVRIDITEVRAQRAAAEQAQAAAEAAGRRLHDAIESLPDGFALYDADDRLVMCNARYREIYRESAAAMTEGAHFEDILRYGLACGQYPQAAGCQDEWLAAQLHRHRNPGPAVIQQLPGNRWLRIDERPTRDGGIAGVRTEITELVRREQQLVELNARLDEAKARLEQLSDTDALTGIANRRHFDRRLDEEWSRREAHGPPLALILGDIDFFKAYNDQHGHPTGDEALRRVARALANVPYRPTDLVARYGGEEFAILLPHTDAVAAVRVAERALAAVDMLGIPHASSAVAGHVTLSLGLALAQPGRAGRLEDLLEAADRALYRAKAAGRHRLDAAG